MPLLKLKDVSCKSVLSGNLSRHRKVIDALILLQAFKKLILIGLVVDISEPTY
jgi:hypothetical protein